jgi:hypothetical protein
MKGKIKRKIRINEHTTLSEYTGLIFVSNKILPIKNSYQHLKLNVTKFFTNNHNNFFLENSYIDNKKLDNHLLEKYNINQEDILEIQTIFEKPKKIVYLVYLKFNTKFNFNYTLINIYNINKLKKTNDLYLTIYNSHSKIKCSDFKMNYDKDSYLLINCKNIYYYLIGNDNTNIDLEEYINSKDEFDSKYTNKSHSKDIII